MNGATPVQCVNCGTEQSFGRVYCARCHCSLDAAKPLGQTRAGTFLIVILLGCAALMIGFVAIALLFFGLDDVSPMALPLRIKAVGVALLALATSCVWGIWRLARR